MEKKGRGKLNRIEAELSDPLMNFTSYSNGSVIADYQRSNTENTVKILKWFCPLIRILRHLSIMPSMSRKNHVSAQICDFHTLTQFYSPKFFASNGLCLDSLQLINCKIWTRWKRRISEYHRGKSNGNHVSNTVFFTAYIVSGRTESLAVK